ncbi:MAG: hypothetical protein OXH57_07280 [Ekhidna sp.]|nr:hypothetical protein [Ekhidna sp.]
MGNNSPLLKKVENAGIEGIKRKRKPFHITPADFFEEANTIRQLYAQFINTPESNRIVLIPSVWHRKCDLESTF